MAGFMLTCTFAAFCAEGMDCGNDVLVRAFYDDATGTAVLLENGLWNRAAMELDTPDMFLPPTRTFTVTGATVAPMMLTVNDASLEAAFSTHLVWMGTSAVSGAGSCTRTELGENSLRDHLEGPATPGQAPDERIETLICTIPSLCVLSSGTCGDGMTVTAIYADDGDIAEMDFGTEPYPVIMQMSENPFSLPRRVFFTAGGLPPVTLLVVDEQTMRGILSISPSAGPLDMASGAGNCSVRE